MRRKGGAGGRCGEHSLQEFRIRRAEGIPSTKHLATTNTGAGTELNLGAV